MGLLMLIALGGYWITMHKPQQQPVVQDKVTSTIPPSDAGESSANRVPSGISPVFPPVLSPPASVDGSNAGTAIPSPAVPLPKALGNATPAQSIENADRKPLTREERRDVRAQIDVKTKELLAKGKNVTPADTQAYLNDVERLGKGIFDSKYFSVMREMVGYSARTQELSQELNQIANSKAPKDIARQQAILLEIRDIGDRISNGATMLQSYARDAAMVKTP